MRSAYLLKTHFHGVTEVSFRRMEMEREAVYHSDPQILGGTPVFKGTRVPVQTLLDYLEGGDTLDDFLKGFPTVSRDQAVSFLELAKNALLATS